MCILVAAGAYRRDPGGIAVCAAVWIRRAALRLAERAHHARSGSRPGVLLSAAPGRERRAGVQPQSAAAGVGADRTAGNSSAAAALARALAPRPRMLPRIHQLGPAERRTLALACLCNFCLLASFYILRPVRDTMATVLGTGRLQELFTATFIGTLIASPLYAALTSRIRLQWLLPGASWFWLINVLLFAALLHAAPDNHWIGAGYYVWFSVVNLFMISIFWSLMVDV